MRRRSSVRPRARSRRGGGSPRRRLPAVLDQLALERCLVGMPQRKQRHARPDRGPGGLTTPFTSDSTLVQHAATGRPVRQRQDDGGSSAEPRPCPACSSASRRSWGPSPSVVRPSRRGRRSRRGRGDLDDRRRRPDHLHPGRPVGRGGRVRRAQPGSPRFSAWSCGAPSVRCWSSVSSRRWAGSFPEGRSTPCSVTRRPSRKPWRPPFGLLLIVGWAAAASLVGGRRFVRRDIRGFGARTAGHAPPCPRAVVTHPWPCPGQSWRARSGSLLGVERVGGA